MERPKIPDKLEQFWTPPPELRRRIADKEVDWRKLYYIVATLIEKKTQRKKSHVSWQLVKMSAAKMVADSTQADLPEKVTKKRKETQKKKVKRKKDKATVKKGKKKASDDEFDDYDLDLENEVRPMGAFVKDREELVRQLFHCVRGTSLKRALPEVLKELPLDDLQRRCLEQLEVMSKKRIRRIIAGDDPAAISSSGTEDETSEEEPELDVREQPEEDDEMAVYDEDDLVDSTSQYAEELEASEREFDEHEEGSLGHSSPSPVPSDDLVESPLMEQEESTSSEIFQDKLGELDDVSLTKHEESQAAVSDHETEEGEVTDNDPVDKEETLVTVTGDVGEAIEKVVVVVENGDNDNVDNNSDNIDKISEDIDGAGADDNEDDQKCAVDKQETVGDKPDSDNDDQVEEPVARSNRVVLPPSSEALAPVLTQNQMELLELEMRARAIRAMLKSAK